LQVNGADYEVLADGGTTLLKVLRDQLGMTGAKEACGRGECGACTVLIGGAPVLACLTLAARVEEEVLTAEGLSAGNEDLRRAFADHGGFQCGFCTPGQIVSATALLAGMAAGSAEEIRSRMAGNVCRCTGYGGIVQAIMDTAQQRSSRPAETAS
jgi:aerobic-type carbon monoxide dehydrogenase small subunit (CoxS/CutS family)